MKLKSLKFTWLPLMISAQLLIGCVSGNCRQNRPIDAGMTVDGTDQTQASSQIKDKTDDLTNRVRVFKYDGSLQCSMGKALSPKEMETQLSGVKIFSAENKADGLMHIQVCGSATGKANVFEIDRKDLPEAKKKGFKEWTYQ